MKFLFCGEADCPDWVLAEINTLSRLSSIKLKQLTQIVIEGILRPPLNYEKAEKLFAETKLGGDLKACIACIEYIITSTVASACKTDALHSELQQLGLPREHSTSIRRILDEKYQELIENAKNKSLRINNFESSNIDILPGTDCANVSLNIDGKKSDIVILGSTLSALLEDLLQVRKRMLELNEVKEKCIKLSNDQ